MSVSGLVIGWRIHSRIAEGAAAYLLMFAFTFAMIFGILPMAIGHGAGGNINAPMARSVIGGVISSTVLTLVRRRAGR